MALLLSAAPALVVLDSNLITVALPSIRHELGMTHEELGWVVSAYGLSFGAAVLPVARAVDVYGGRVVLSAGLIVFATAAGGAALSPSGPVLLAWRALQGLGAALMLPSSLALMAAGFAQGGPRERAFGLYGAVISAAFVVAVLPGGALISLVGWRAAPASEVLLAALIWLALRQRPGTNAARHGRFGGRLAAMVPVPPLLVLLGLGEMASSDGDVLAGALAMALGALIAGVIAARDRRSETPLIPSALRENGALLAACLAAFLTVATGVGVMFALTVHLQETLNREPAFAGVVLAVLGLAGIPAGLATPRLVRSLGVVRALCAALLLQALGAGLLTEIDADGCLGWIFAGSAVLGAGHFSATAAFTILASARVPPSERGIAMGMISASQQLGGACGLALLAGVVGASATLHTGLRWALLIAVALSVVAALLVALLVKRR